MYTILKLNADNVSPNEVIFVEVLNTDMTQTSLFRNISRYYNIFRLYNTIAHTFQRNLILNIQATSITNKQ